MSIKRNETKMQRQQRKHSVGLTHGAGGIVAETIREGAQERRLNDIKNNKDFSK